MRVHRSALFVLVAFVALLSARDIVYDLALRDCFGFIHSGVTTGSGVAFALVTCAIISLASALTITARGEWGHFARRMVARPIWARSLFMGLGAAAIYGVTFSVIERIGAGLFNLIDWGLSPMLTAAVGYYLWQDLVRPRVLLGVMALGVGGITGLYHFGALGSSTGSGGPAIVVIALVSPVCTALSFSMQRWLLLPEHGGLSRQEVLLARFLTATLALAAYAAATQDGTLTVRNPAVSLAAAAVLGGAPAIIVCAALVRGALTRFATWQFAIPATTYIATLPAYPENRSLWSLAFALIVVAAVVIMERYGEAPAPPTTAEPASGSEG